MSGTWLEQFHGERIAVLSAVGSEERTDTGALLQMGEGWMQILKDNGDMILIPYSAVRIVKLLDRTQTTQGIVRDALPRIDNRIHEPNAQKLP